MNKRIINIKTQPINVLIGMILIFLTLNCYSQNKIHFIPDTININIDTTGITNISALNDYNNDRFNMSFNVENNSDLDLKLDTNSQLELNPIILRAHQSGTLYLYKSSYYNKKIDEKVLPLAFKAPLVNEKIIDIAFICGNKKTKASIYFNYTYGKSKMLSIDNPIWIMDTIVENMFNTEKTLNNATTYNNFHGIIIKRKVTIKNISNKVFVLQKSGIAYNDWGSRLSYSDDMLQIVKPNQSKEVAIALYMDRKKRFNVFGNLIVHTFNYSNIEIFFTRFKSSFFKEDK